MVTKQKIYKGVQVYISMDNNHDHILSKRIRKFLHLDNPVKLVLDSCPLGFNPSDAGKITPEEIERSLRAMKKINSYDKK